MKTGELIKKYRCTQQLTTKQVGDMVGLSGGAISQYERGVRSIRKEVFEKIAKHLMISDSDKICLEDMDYSDLNIQNQTTQVNVNNFFSDESIESDTIAIADVTDSDDNIIVLSYSNEFKEINKLSSLFHMLDCNFTVAYSSKSNKFIITLEDPIDNSTKYLEVNQLKTIENELKRYLKYLLFFPNNN